MTVKYACPVAVSGPSTVMAGAAVWCWRNRGFAAPSAVGSLPSSTTESRVPVKMLRISSTPV